MQKFLLTLIRLIGFADNPVAPEQKSQIKMSEHKKRVNDSRREAYFAKGATLSRNPYATLGDTSWYVNTWNVGGGVYYAEVESQVGDTSTYYNLSVPTFSVFDSAEAAFEHGRAVLLIMLRDKLQLP